MNDLERENLPKIIKCHGCGAWHFPPPDSDEGCLCDGCVCERRVSGELTAVLRALELPGMQGVAP